MTYSKGVLYSLVPGVHSPACRMSRLSLCLNLGIGMGGLGNGPSAGAKSAHALYAEASARRPASPCRSSSVWVDAQGSQTGWLDARCQCGVRAAQKRHSSRIRSSPRPQAFREFTSSSITGMGMIFFLSHP